MNRVLAIARRELFSFFVTPRGYILFSLFGALCGFYFFNILGRFNFLVSRSVGMQIDIQMTLPTLQEFVIARYYQFVVASFVVFIPLLTMRSITADRMNGTFALLRTSPLSSLELMLGKYIALAISVTLFTALAGVYVLSLTLYGSPDIGMLLSGLFGVYLCGLAFAALGLAVGARTEHQVTAAIGGVVLLAVLTLSHTPAPLLGSPYREILNTVSPVHQLDPFIYGFIPLAGVLYFLVGIGLGIAAGALLLAHERTVPDSVAQDPRNGVSMAILTSRDLSLSGALIFIGGLLHIAVQGRVITPVVLIHVMLGAGLVGVGTYRLFFRSPGTRIGSISSLQATVQAVVAVAISVLALAVAGRGRFGLDVSSHGAHTLSEQSVAAVKRLAQPLHITYITRRDEEADLQTARYLERFVRLDPAKVTFTVVDPALSPRIPLELGLRAGEFIALQRGDDRSHIARLQRADEETVRGAILSLTEPSPQRVYIVDGLGCARADDEGAFGSAQFVAALRWENLDVQALSVASAAAVPSDAALLILIGPREQLPTSFAEDVVRYVKAGGALLATADPLFAPNIAAIFEPLGVRSRNTVVLDSDQLMFSRGAAGLQPLIRLFSHHPITNSLGNNGAVVMNAATSLNASHEGDPAFSVAEFAFASPGSIEEPRALDVLQGRVDFSAISDLRDLSSHPAVGVAVTDMRSDQPRAVLIGDSDWLLNAAFPYYSNRDLALNAVSWLLKRTWALVPRAVHPQNESVAVSSGEFERMMVISILGLELVVLLGVLGCARRVRVR